MKIENSEALKSWLAANLSKMCNADPTALSKYICALVKKEKSETELREFCLDQLEVFLLSETERFVDLLFEVLKNKAYLTGLSKAHVSENSSIPKPIRNDATIPTSCEVEQSGEPGRGNSPKCKKNENDIMDVSVKKMKSVTTALKSKIKNGSPEKSLKSQRDISEDGFCKRSEVEKGGDDRKNNVNLLPSKRFHPIDMNKVVEIEKGKNDKQAYKFDSNDDPGCRPKSNSCDKRKEETVEPDKTDLANMPTECQERFLDHGDTDYRQKKDMSSISVSSLPRCILSTNYITKVSERCQDYDEKGYCMRGDFCQFDHGTDPILVENVGALNFGVEDGSKSPNGLQPAPPPPPPLPPPMPPVSFFSPEPYNPESPGMNVRSSMNHLSFFGPLSTSHHMSPRTPSHNMTYSHGVECFHNSKPIRARELIGVPTVDSLSMNEKFSDINTGKNGKYSTVSDETSKSSPTESKEMLKRKGFDFNRLGPNPSKAARFHSNYRKGTVLEIRKIPKHLNTISMINEHFSKFGTIVNLKVCYDGDSEAALVQFSNHVEANSAYRSTDAVFNNRFIKVFWHNNDSLNELVNNSTISSENETECRRNESSFGNVEQNNFDKVPQRPLSMYSKVNKNLPRNTYHSSLSLKKNNFPESLPASTPMTRKLKEEEQRKDTLKKRLTIQTTKQDFLKAHMENQKLILEKLSKTKNVKEKEFLKKTLHTMSEKIACLQNELRRDSEDLKNLLKTAFVPVVIVSKSTAEKELLDAELELYNKQHTGDDTAELLSKVNELKQKAEAYIDSCLPKMPCGAPKQMAIGNSKYLPKASSHSIDHRPRSIIIKGLLDPVINKQDLIKHFSKFGKIENIKENETGGGVIISFSKRIEAELAYARGSKLGDCTISIAWFQDTQASNVAGSDNSGNLLVEIMNPTPAAEGDDEDEEEEEDSEARSWRR